MMPCAISYGTNRSGTTNLLARQTGLGLRLKRATASHSRTRAASIAAVADAGLTQSDGEVAEAHTDQGDCGLDVLRRPRRGSRALRRQASVFRRLLANPPLRPFPWLASCLSSLRTAPPNLPSATACGFLRTDFLITPLHFIAPLPLERGMKRTNL